MEINSSPNANCHLNANGHSHSQVLDSTAKAKLIDQVLLQFLNKLCFVI